MRPIVFALSALLAAHAVLAAPDEDALGKAARYPAGRNLKQAYEEAYRVGSFSAMDRIAPSCRLEPAANPVPLPRAAVEPGFTYRFQGVVVLFMQIGALWLETLYPCGFQAVSIPSG